MADNNYLHTAEIMKAASPYVDSRTKTTMDFVAKLMDLMGSLRTFANKTDLAACGYEDQKMNLEGLLNGIKPLCRGKELEFVDQILNIFNARRMYETYNTYMNTMKAMQGFEGFPFGGSPQNEDNAPSGGSSGFDFSAFFNNFSGDNIHANEQYGGTDPVTNHDTQEAASEHLSAAENKASDEKVVGADRTCETPKDNPGESSKEENSSAGVSNTSNMMDMLKSMIPPDQMSTFENLSMLFNTMSYDGNRKPDDV